MSVLRKIFYKGAFCLDKFNRKYPFDLKSQQRGYIKNFGEKNPDKTFYVIWHDFLGSGFFSNFKQVVLHIKLAEHLGMTPVVDCQNFKTLYSEQDPVNNTTNSWEYYFKQVSPHTLEEVYQSKRVFFCSGEFPRDISFNNLPKGKEAGFYKGESYKEFVEKRIELQDAVKDEVKKYEHFFKKRTLGIHFRGKEMNIAQHHPFGATVEQMLRYTDEIITKFNIEQIFLATEEKDYLDLFIKKYGSKVVFYDAFRVSKVNAYNLKNPRPQHRYLLGMDALVDALLLARCTGLLYGPSGIPEYARLTGDHEFTYHINNGINFNKWYLAKYAFRVKKILPKKFGGLLDEVTIKIKK